MRRPLEVEKILTSLEGKLQYSRLVTVHATPYFCYEFQIYDHTSPLSHGRLKTSQWQAAQIGENRKSREKTYPSPRNGSLLQASKNYPCLGFLFASSCQTMPSVAPSPLRAVGCPATSPSECKRAAVRSYGKEQGARR